MSNRQQNKFWIPIGSIALFVLAWWVASLVISDHQILPDPWQVFLKIGDEFASGELARHMIATLGRVIAAFVVAMTIGMALGLIMGRSSGINSWADPWLIILLNLPALVTIVLCYLWIGLNEVAAISAVAINKIPLVTVMIREGARALDTRLDQMATSFDMPPMTKLRHIILPQLGPHIAAAARSGIALVWKIVLVVEFLGRSNGIGFQIHLGFQLFDVTMVLAYALAFIAVMLAIEILILQPVERHANRWRQA